MDEIVMTAPAWVSPGDTTYVGQSAYTVTVQRTIEQVRADDIPGLEAAGYSRPVAVTVTETPVTDAAPAESDPSPESTSVTG